MKHPHPIHGYRQAILVLGAALLTLGFPAFAASSDSTPPLEAESGKTISRTFSVDPGGKLSAEVDRGSIEVTAADGNKVEIVVERKVSGASDSKEAEVLKAHVVTITQEGNEVRIRAKLGKEFSGGGWFGSSPNLNVRYKISVPRKFDAALASGGGSIRVTELQGKVDAKSGGGSLDFVKIQGPVIGSTGGGSIKAVGCTEKLEFKTGGGSIDINGSIGSPVSAKTGGGSISADLAAQPKSDCSFTTGGGSIHLTIPETLAANLNASTGGGSVSTDIPVAGNDGKKRSRLQGAINGGGPELLLKSGGGSIKVSKK